MLNGMQEAIDTRDSSLVQAEVQKVYLEMFPDGDRTYVPTIFQWARGWFTGGYRDYQAIDVQYHDLEHTMQGVLCMARLLRGLKAQKQKPILTQRLAELGLLAILMHDTGYLKKRGDKDGTGAKYTLTHVDRSIDFAGEQMRANNFSESEVLAVQNMIRCTGVNVKLDSVKFNNELERVVGYCMGTADLLGQMAALDYVEKLPVLYAEFAEANCFNAGKMQAGGFFTSAEDLIEKTPMFWENYVRPRINRDFLGLYRFLNDPYPDGPNAYVDRIEANIARIRRKAGERAA
jgi:hypothetical protein